MSISIPHIPGLSGEFRRICQHTSVQVIFKDANTLKSTLTHPEIKFYHNKIKPYTTNGPAQKKIFNFSYIEEPSRCLENRVKEHNSVVTCVIYKHSNNNNHSHANVFLFRIIDKITKRCQRR